MTTTNEQPSMTWSYWKGLTFHFRDNNNEIRANASLFSGRETIYLNEEKVSTKHSMRKKSVHKFSDDNVQYEIEYSVESITKGNLTCTLIKDGVHCKTFQFVSFGELKKLPSFKSKKRFWFSVITWAVAGYIIGATAAHFFKAGM